jgi:hypothetical protein
MGQVIVRLCHRKSLKLSLASRPMSLCYARLDTNSPPLDCSSSETERSSSWKKIHAKKSSRTRSLPSLIESKYQYFSIKLYMSYLTTSMVHSTSKTSSDTGLRENSNISSLPHCCNPVVAYGISPYPPAVHASPTLVCHGCREGSPTWGTRQGTRARACSESGRRCRFASSFEVGLRGTVACVRFVARGRRSARHCAWDCSGLVWRWWHDKGLWQRDRDMKPYPSLCLDESNSIRSCDEDISLKMSR